MSKNCWIWLLLCFSVVVYSCDEPDCFSQVTNVAQLSFFSIETNTRDTLVYDSINVIGLPLPLLDTTTSITGLFVPLNPGEPATRLLFSRLGNHDTLTISYQRRSRFISEDCGLEIIYADLEAEAAAFDSIAVLNPILIEESNEDNIRIYN